VKKIALLAVLALALAGARLEAGVVLAGTQARSDSPDRNIILFTATYENIIGGTFTLRGISHPQQRAHESSRAVYSYRAVDMAARHLHG